MWKTGLVAAAVGTGVLVAVIVFGRPLVEPGTPPEPPPAVTTALRAWAERASDQCEQALGTVRAELSGAPGLTSASARLVRLFSVTTEIEGRLARLLRALPPTAAERKRVDEVLGLLELQYERDVRTAAKLERRFDEALLRREITAYEQRAIRMRRLFRELGATGCVRYLDPASYG